MDDEGPDTSVWTVGLIVGWWLAVSVILAYVPYSQRVSVWRWLHVLVLAWIGFVAPSLSLTTGIGLGMMFGISWGIGHEVLKTTV